MLTIEGFISEMRRLYLGYSKKFSEETTELYYALSLKKLPNMNDNDFSEIVDDILTNESSFPSFAKIADYYHKTNGINKTESVTDCIYCRGVGKVIYEKYEELYDDYITVSCNCICGNQAKGISNIVDNGMQELIDTGCYILDKDGVFRKPERVKFTTNCHEQINDKQTA